MAVKGLDIVRSALTLSNIQVVTIKYTVKLDKGHYVITRQIGQCKPQDGKRALTYDDMRNYLESSVANDSAYALRSGISVCISAPATTTTAVSKDVMIEVRASR